jgi:hypothetical protein
VIFWLIIGLLIATVRTALDDQQAIRTRRLADWSQAGQPTDGREGVVAQPAAAEDVTGSRDDGRPSYATVRAEEAAEAVSGRGIGRR